MASSNPTTASSESVGPTVPTLASSCRQTDQRPWKESGGRGVLVTLPPDPQPKAPIPGGSNWPLPRASAFPSPTPYLQLWASLPGWVLPLSLGLGRVCWGCVGGNHEQKRQEDVQGGPARDAWHSKRGLCPRQHPLLLSARDRLSLGLAPVSWPPKRRREFAPSTEVFSFSFCGSETRS